MTEQEWAAIAELVDSWWPGEFSDVDERAWLELLRGYDREQVLRAVRASLRSSPRFRPAAGELLAILEPGPPPAPSWTDAYAVLFGPGGVVRRSITSGDDAALVLAEGAHPYIRAFCDRYGLERLRMEPVEDPDIGGAVLKRMGDDWADHVRICGERLEAGRSLEAMGRRGELGKLDPLAAMNAGVHDPETQLAPLAQRLDEDAAEGRSIAELDAIRQEHGPGGGS